MKQKVIIKRVKKRGHTAAHGGSWKVAYADFVTAMMAFFLLLWLITMIAPEKRARVAAYFKEFSLFERSGTSMIMAEHGGVTGEGGGAFGKLDRRGVGITDVMSPKELKEKVKKAVSEKLADVQNQVLVDGFEGGVRIQIVDDEGRAMFPLGSAEPNPRALKILSVIAGNIRTVGNRIVIEGHTDALDYSSGRYTNWELSTERASAARKALEQDGIDPERLVMVAGFAATRPLIAGAPNDPRNRRISILLLAPVRDGKTSEGQERE